MHAAFRVLESGLPPTLPEPVMKNGLRTARRIFRPGQKKVKEILAQGPRKALAPKVLAELDAIVAKAEKKYK